MAATAEAAERVQLGADRVRVGAGRCCCPNSGAESDSNADQYFRDHSAVLSRHVILSFLEMKRIQVIVVAVCGSELSQIWTASTKLRCSHHCRMLWVSRELTHQRRPDARRLLEHAAWSAHSYSLTFIFRVDPPDPVAEEGPVKGKSTEGSNDEDREQHPYRFSH